VPSASLAPEPTPELLVVVALPLSLHLNNVSRDPDGARFGETENRERSVTDAAIDRRLAQAEQAGRLGDGQ
jgi:hypothetical protein